MERFLGCINTSCPKLVSMDDDVSKKYSTTCTSSTKTSRARPVEQSDLKRHRDCSVVFLDKIL